MPDLTFSELKKVNTVRCETSFHPIESWTAFEWLACVVGELGEAANKLKKVKRRDGSATVDDVLEELADTIIYLDLLFVALGGDMGAEIIKKFNKKSEEIGSFIFLGKDDPNRMANCTCGQTPCECPF